MPTATGRSTKRQLIDKANARTVLYVSVAAFILVFSLVATKTLISQASYQNKVITKKRAAVNQLKSDLAATKQLKTSYDAFTSTAQNVLGGNPSGTGPQDGNNAKIVLDALPSGYDFPGTMTSVENLINSQPGVKITGTSGTDDEVAQSGNQTSVSPSPVAIPFGVSVQADYKGVQSVISAFQHSIRPLAIQKLTISGGQGALSLDISAQTYYQPAKSLNIQQVVVK